jgi:hypothetical protein
MKIKEILEILNHSWIILKNNLIISKRNYLKIFIIIILPFVIGSFIYFLQNFLDETLKERI